MSQNSLTSVLHVLILMLLVSGFDPRPARGAQPLSNRDNVTLPNIVLLVADDLGYGEIGNHSSSSQQVTRVPTPHIDALASSGVTCTQAYVTAPNCSPSRAGIFTGRVPTRFGYEFNPIGARNEDAGTGLPASELTMPEMLRDAGYTTGLIGKWHLGGTADYHPYRHGFDEFFGFLHEGHYFVPPPWLNTMTMLRRKNLPSGSSSRYQATDLLIYSSHMNHDEPPYDANNPILRGSQPMAEDEYLTDAFTREATNFIERYSQTPFLLCVTYNAVHSPLQGKLETLTEFEHIDDIHRRIFAAMLSDLDRSVGKIVETLRQKQLNEQTLVIFLSDNGGPTRELTSSNLPLRDGKGSMYEGGLRVPFIASWPDRLPANQVCHEIVSSMDIFATAAQMAGVQPASNVEGHDLLPLLTDHNAKSKHQTLFWRQGDRAALRHGPWKIVDSRGTNRGKDANRQWELYNIDSDITESENMAAAHPEQVELLQKKWNQLNREMAEPLF